MGRSRARDDVLGGDEGGDRGRGGQVRAAGLAHVLAFDGVAQQLLGGRVAVERPGRIEDQDVFDRHVDALVLHPDAVVVEAVDAQRTADLDVHVASEHVEIEDVLHRHELRELVRDAHRGLVAKAGEGEDELCERVAVCRGRHGDGLGQEGQQWQAAAQAYATALAADVRVHTVILRISGPAADGSG